MPYDNTLQSIALARPKICEIFFQGNARLGLHMFAFRQHKVCLCFPLSGPQTSPKSQNLLKFSSSTTDIETLGLFYFNSAENSECSYQEHLEVEPKPLFWKIQTSNSGHFWPINKLHLFFPFIFKTIDELKTLNFKSIYAVLSQI